jgi:myosin-1
MEVQFDFKGEPLGGKIINYLLEKCRVVYQMPGERNFHVFYMLLTSADSALRQRLALDQPATAYRYTNQVWVLFGFPSVSTVLKLFVNVVNVQGNAEKVSTINDQEEFRDLLQAFKKLEFGDDEVNVRIMACQCVSMLSCQHCWLLVLSRLTRVCRSCSPW